MVSNFLRWWWLWWCLACNWRNAKCPARKLQRDNVWKLDGRGWKRWAREGTFKNIKKQWKNRWHERLITKAVWCFLCRPQSPAAGGWRRGVQAWERGATVQQARGSVCAATETLACTPAEPGGDITTRTAAQCCRLRSAWRLSPVPCVQREYWHSLVRGLANGHRAQDLFLSSTLWLWWILIVWYCWINFLRRPASIMCNSLPQMRWWSKLKVVD